MLALSHSNIIDGKRYKGCLVKRDVDRTSANALEHWCTIQVTEGKVRESAL